MMKILNSILLSISILIIGCCDNQAKNYIHSLGINDMRNHLNNISRDGVETNSVEEILRQMHTIYKSRYTIKSKMSPILLRMGNELRTAKMILYKDRGNLYYMVGYAWVHPWNKSGLSQDWDAFLKQVEQNVSDSITWTAERVYNYITLHPLDDSKIYFINGVILRVKPQVNRFVDTDPRTMNWIDLTFAWFFELGDENVIFLDGYRTTEDLKKHYGVNMAREKARIAYSEKDPLTLLNWQYGRSQFWHSLWDVDTVAGFLGSYSILVVTSRDRCEYGFEVYNSTGWESGTRFRKASHTGKSHQGIISDRKRGSSGINLGGKMTEKWKWNEYILNK